LIHTAETIDDSQVSVGVLVRESPGCVSGARTQHNAEGVHYYMTKMGWIMFILDTGAIAEGRYQQELMIRMVMVIIPRLEYAARSLALLELRVLPVR